MVLGSRLRILKMKGLLQSDLFDVENITQTNEQLKQKQQEEQNIKARQSLELPYYSNPKNDSERLLNYQYEYIKNNNEKAWGDLITLSFIVTKRLVWRWMKLHKLQLDDIEQDEKTSIAVEYVLRRYKTRIGYCVTKNFITALNDGVKHAMLYTTKIEEQTVLMSDIKEIKTL